MAALTPAAIAAMSGLMAVGIGRSPRETRCRKRAACVFAMPGSMVRDVLLCGACMGSSWTAFAPAQRRALSIQDRGPVASESRPKVFHRRWTEACRARANAAIGRPDFALITTTGL